MRCDHRNQWYPSRWCKSMIIFLLSLELFRRRCNVAWSISAVVVFDILYGHHEFTPNKDFFVSAQRWKLVNWTKPNITLMTFLKKTHDWQWKQVASWHQGCTSCGSLAARKRRENEKMEREWENEEEMKRDLLSIFPLFLSTPSLSISFAKNCLILLQNVEYDTFVANVTKNLSYVLCENDSGSNSLQESCAGLHDIIANNKTK